jgi:hypothetical protein
MPSFRPGLETGDFVSKLETWHPYTIPCDTILSSLFRTKTTISGQLNRDGFLWPPLPKNLIDYHNRYIEFTSFLKNIEIT